MQCGLWTLRRGDFFISLPRRGPPAKSLYSCKTSTTAEVNTHLSEPVDSHRVSIKMSASPSRQVHLKCQVPRSCLSFPFFSHRGKTCLICFRLILIYWSIISNLENIIFQLWEMNECFFVFWYIYHTYLFISETQAEYSVLWPENRV